MSKQRWHMEGQMIKIIFGMIIGGFIVYHNPDIGIDIVNFFINFLKEVLQ